MNREKYMPSIQRLVEIVDQEKNQLSIEDQRHLSRLKNWMREGEELREFSYRKARGIK